MNAFNLFQEIRRANKKRMKSQIKSLHYQIFAKETHFLFNFIIQQNKID
jgi:LytS/YehU family sensor histidine kinase